MFKELKETISNNQKKSMSTSSHQTGNVNKELEII